jgi:ubiquinone/menaquinone biosynthesis C-methylase UbiE
LDIGCGNGSITVEIGKKLGLKTVYGIDLKSFAGIDIQSVDAPPDINFERKEYDGIDIPYADNTFDLITMMQVFHHVQHPDALLTNIHRVLKKDGLIILREHYKENEIDSLLFRLEHILYSIFEDGSTLEQFSANYYDNYYSRYDLITIFEKYGFKYLYMNEISPEYNKANYYYIAFRCIKR